MLVHPVPTAVKYGFVCGAVEPMKFGSLGFRMVELKLTANSANSREKIKKSVQSV